MDILEGRYKIVTGKQVNIKELYKNDIEEIEVFGETYQNNTNLKDIDSVGDLYVDKNGNPILDRLGRKQYKLTLVSKNKNLLNKEDLIQGFYTYGAVGTVPTLNYLKISLKV